MNYSFNISTRKGDEYRIMLSDADVSMLAQKVRDTLVDNNIDISEIFIYGKPSSVRLFKYTYNNRWRGIQAVYALNCS